MSSLRRLLSPSCLLAGFTLCGCTGSIFDPSPSGGAGPPGSPGSVSGPDAGPAGQLPGAAEGEIGPAPLRRLSKWELVHAYEDLLGGGAIDPSLVPDDTRGSYGFSTSPGLGPTEVQRLESVVRKAVSGAVDAGQQLPGVQDCQPADKTEAACVRGLIEGFGRLVFRRPLSEREVTTYTGLFGDLRSGEGKLSYEEARAGVVEALLQSPQFLYRRELGDELPLREGELIKLTPYELAARLSFTLWASPPDDALLQKAEQDALGSADRLTSEARRLIADPRFGRTLSNFHRQWLRIEALPSSSKDKQLFPSFDAALAGSMAGEMDRFVEHTIVDEGSIQALLASPYSYPDDRLLSFYGVSGTALQKTELPAQRAGILTRAGFLTVHAGQGETSPVKRGKVLLESVLCRTVPPPPANVNVVPPTPDPTKQTREQFEAHSTNPSCANCHRLMDPLGFAFEQFDAIGQDRSVEAGRPVDTSGKIELDGSELSFANAPELVNALSTSPEVRACYARHWTRYYLGRQESDAEEQGLQAAIKTFSDQAGDIRELLVAIVQAPSFRYRAPSPGEVLK